MRQMLRDVQLFLAECRRFVIITGMNTTTTALKQASSRIDSAWFAAQIKSSSYGSMRQIAAHLKSRYGTPMDVSSLSKLVAGKRTMLVTEARQIADLLHVPFVEVARRAGIRMNDTARSVPLIGSIAGDGTATLLPPVDADSVAGPDSLPAGATALDIDGSLFGGGLVFVAPRRPATAKDEDRLALVGLPDGTAALAYVRRKGGKHTLLAFPGMTSTKRQGDVELAWIAPVLWLKTR